MSNGVKQCGVISLFFSLYIDPLLLEMKRSGLVVTLTVFIWVFYHISKYMGFY